VDHPQGVADSFEKGKRPRRECRAINVSERQTPVGVADGAWSSKHEALNQNKGEHKAGAGRAYLICDLTCGRGDKRGRIATVERSNRRDV